MDVLGESFCLSEEYRYAPNVSYRTCMRTWEVLFVVKSTVKLNGGPIPFETFSRFAAQMTIPCFTAARLGSDRGDLKERLVIEVRLYVAHDDPWRWPAKRPPAACFFPFSHSIKHRKGQCARGFFSSSSFLSDITYVMRRQALLDLGGSIVRSLSPITITITEECHVASIDDDQIMACDRHSACRSRTELSMFLIDIPKSDVALREISGRKSMMLIISIYCSLYAICYL